MLDVSISSNYDKHVNEIFINFRKILCTELIPVELEKELRSVYVCTCELLRHFWKSFPPTTPQLEEKAVRMHEALHRFHAARLKKFEVSIELNESLFGPESTIYFKYTFIFQGSCTARSSGSKSSSYHSPESTARDSVSEICCLAATENANEVAVV